VLEWCREQTVDVTGHFIHPPKKLNAVVLNQTTCLQLPPPPEKNLIYYLTLKKSSIALCMLFFIVAEMKCARSPVYRAIDVQFFESRFRLLLKHSCRSTNRNLNALGPTHCAHTSLASNWPSFLTPSWHVSYGAYKGLHKVCSVYSVNEENLTCVLCEARVSFDNT
jgi:hypothetical protein